MTVFVPLEASSPFPPSPSFLVHCSDPNSQVTKVIKAIMKARRIVVVCGAGISVQAGIPDFRSPEGLFQTLKRENPRELLTSGRDLFDASVFNSEHTTSLFLQMIARLSVLSSVAEPTPFHHALHALDKRGKLLRVYTQNIDAIESKCGLSLGVPDFNTRRAKSRSKGKAPAPASERCTPIKEDPSDAILSVRLPSPPPDIPRCVPLHGTLQSMHCQSCTHICPLAEHLLSLMSGMPPQCPECIATEDIRQMLGKRARGVGKLRPNVVLYNEEHKNGEGVGEVVRKDLMGGSKGKGRGGADLLLVVGTSLRVPGTKRIVREFAKAARSRSGAPTTKDTPSSYLLTPAPTPRRSPATETEPPVRSVYLNLDFPVPTREWEGVFDVWLQGDAQSFATLLQEEIEKDARAREATSERKRKRAEEAAFAREGPPVKQKKTKGISPSSAKSANKRRVDPSQRHSKGKLAKKPVSVSPFKQARRPKVVIRIPASSRPNTPSSKLMVPQVYIPTPPPSRRKFVPHNHSSSSLSELRSQGTDDSPYPASQTPHRSRSPSFPSASYITPDDSGDESSELSEVPDELPTGFHYARLEDG